MATLLQSRPRTRPMTEADELRQVVERFEFLERQFLAQMRDDLEGAAARQVLARTDNVAAALTQALAATARVSRAVESPAAEEESIAAVRALHQDVVRTFGYAALGLLVLVVLTFIFVMSR